MKRRHATIEAEYKAKEDFSKHSVTTKVRMSGERALKISKGEGESMAEHLKVSAHANEVKGRFEDSDAIVEYLKECSERARGRVEAFHMQHWGKTNDEDGETPEQLKKWVQQLHQCWDQTIEEPIPDTGYQPPTEESLEPTAQLRQDTQLQILEETTQAVGHNSKAREEPKTENKHDIKLPVRKNFYFIVILAKCLGS